MRGSMGTSVRKVGETTIVRAAERECFARGVQFRGRQYPIYAKEVALKISAEHMFLEPAKVVRIECEGGGTIAGAEGPRLLVRS